MVLPSSHLAGWVEPASSIRGLRFGIRVGERAVERPATREWEGPAMTITMTMTTEIGNAVDGASGGVRYTRAERSGAR
jgi:hypothetical protein